MTPTKIEYNGVSPSSVHFDADGNLPAIFPCGCSKHKVKADMCAWYRPDGTSKLAPR